MSYKDRTNEALLSRYRKHGYEYTMKLADELLRSVYHSGKSDVGVVFGELAETVLEISVSEYISSRGLKDWFYVKGMILKDIDSMNKDFYTELDFVVFSPSRVFLFESKSYKGTKVFIDKCHLKRPDGMKSFNIYDQHKLHTQVFLRIFNAFRDKSGDSNKAYQLAVFSYAQGTLKDKREQKWKDLMPVVERDDLFELLDTAHPLDKVWDMGAVRKAVSLIEKNKKRNTSRHLDYVSSINRDKR